MRRVLRLLFSAIFLASGTLTAGYTLEGFWLGGLAATVWAVLWVVNILRQRFTFGSLALIGYTVLIVNVLGAGVWHGWALLALLAVLAGWDLEYQLSRLLHVNDEAVVEKMAEAHLQHLGITLTIALLIGSAALLIQYRVNFWLALIVSALAVIGVTRFVSQIRQARS